jgi:hypothetical protein
VLSALAWPHSHPSGTLVAEHQIDQRAIHLLSLAREGMPRLRGLRIREDRVMVQQSLGARRSKIAIIQKRILLDRWLDFASLTNLCGSLAFACVPSLAGERRWTARFARWLRCENRDGRMRVGTRRKLVAQLSVTPRARTSSPIISSTSVRCANTSPFQKRRTR